MPVNPTLFTDDGKLHNDPFAKSETWRILEITCPPSSMCGENTLIYLHQFAGSPVMLWSSITCEECFHANWSQKCAFLVTL